MKMSNIDDIYLYISNMKDNLLLVDIKTEKNIKLDDYQRKAFINLLNKVLNSIEELENFINNEEFKESE